MIYLAPANQDAHGLVILTSAGSVHRAGMALLDDAKLGREMNAQ